MGGRSTFQLLMLSPNLLKSQCLDGGRGGGWGRLTFPLLMPSPNLLKPQNSYVQWRRCGGGGGVGGGILADQLLILVWNLLKSKIPYVNRGGGLGMGWCLTMWDIWWESGVNYKILTRIVPTRSDRLHLLRRLMTKRRALTLSPAPLHRHILGNIPKQIHWGIHHVEDPDLDVDLGLFCFSIHCSCIYLQKWLKDFNCIFQLFTSRLLYRT